MGSVIQEFNVIFFLIRLKGCIKGHLSSHDGAESICEFDPICQYSRFSKKKGFILSYTLFYYKHNLLELSTFVETLCLFLLYTPNFGFLYSFSCLNGYISLILIRVGICILLPYFLNLRSFAFSF